MEPTPHSINMRFAPAGTFDLDTLADLFTRSFAEYFYPVNLSAENLAQQMRVESIDLWHSLVMLVDEQPVGIALLARRGERVWCGGFGITLPWRGYGLAQPLAEAMIDQARQTGARTLTLEVLTRNKRAIRLYTRAGLHITRDLLIVEWRRPKDGLPSKPNVSLIATNADELLEHFGLLHPVAAAWQRELTTLILRGGLLGAALRMNEDTAAYVLYQKGSNGGLRLADLGAQDATQAKLLLAALQLHSKHLVSVNEPANSPLTTAFIAAGFVEIDRQHEMTIKL
ncbi:MAG: GNAT family N-acetyltransferase [Chloroflexales bacterium]|nr:GNAT family N-acetyltransferase [Chloroflexales bacterium]